MRPVQPGDAGPFEGPAVVGLDADPGGFAALGRLSLVEQPGCLGLDEGLPEPALDLDVTGIEAGRKQEQDQTGSTPHGRMLTLG
jgi:hypothetical protein